MKLQRPKGIAAGGRETVSFGDGEGAVPQGGEHTHMQVVCSFCTSAIGCACFHVGFATHDAAVLLASSRMHSFPS